MKENAGPAAIATGISNAEPTAQEYRNEIQKLRGLIQHRAELNKNLDRIEQSIEQEESAYMESTLGGNIIIGFDNYMKGSGGVGASRRKTGMAEQSRIFTQSSVSYRPTDSTSETATPGSVGSAPASHAPTPMSTTFKDGASGAASNHATPTESAAATPTATTGKAGTKKRKYDDGGEGKTGGNSKKRTNFGAEEK